MLATQRSRQHLHAQPQGPQGAQGSRPGCARIGSSLLRRLPAASAKMVAASLEPDAVRAALASRPGEEPDVPVGALLLGCLRLHCADPELAARPAQVDSANGRSQTFAELLAGAVRAAAGWRALGVRPGHCLGYYTKNQVELLPALMGAMFEGITVIPVEPFATENELRHYLSVVPLEALLCERSLLRSAAAEAAPGVRIVVMGDLDDAEVRAAAEARAEGKGAVITLDDMQRQGDALGLDSASYEAAAVPDTHVVAVCFSSGTSGLPKGIVRLNRGFTIAVLDRRAMYRSPPGGRVLLVHPIASAVGLRTTLICMASANTVVLHNYTNERRLLDAVERYEVATLLTAPARIALLAQRVQEERAARADGSPRLPALRFVRTLGSQLSPAVHRRAEEALGVPVLQLYGSTESGTVAGYEAPGLPAGPEPDPRPYKADSTGYLFPGTQLKLVDVESGREVVGCGCLGEVRVKTPTLMAGYVGGIEAFDEEGYYKMGDLGYLDEDGGLHVVDRVKEILKFDAYQVAPAELEAVLLSHPAVREACVVGRKHPRLDALPTAFVALRPGASATERELQDLVKDTLADHKRLRGGVFFVSEIPKASSGKPLRRALRDRLEGLPPLRDEDLPPTVKSKPDCSSTVRREKLRWSYSGGRLSA